MQLATAEAMKQMDRETIEGIGVPSLILMENAGRNVVSVLRDRFLDLTDMQVAVLAGKGNNGGDGLVIARHLINWGAEVDVFVLGEPADLSDETRTNAEILEEMVPDRLKYLPDESSLKQVTDAISNADIVIDALLGIGIVGAVRGFYKKAIELINIAPGYIVSVDLPSGLETDTGHVEGVCVSADLTVTFSLPKVGQLLYPGAEYVGELVSTEIGIPQSVTKKYDSGIALLDESYIRARVPTRQPYSHKGDYGKVFLLAGSQGYTGAAALAGESALRAGAGLVYLGIPETLNPILEGKLTEVITVPLPDAGDGTFSESGLAAAEEQLKRVDVLGLGPGLSRAPGVSQLVRKLLPRVQVPTVVDADGINVLNEGPDLLKQLSNETILTPHPGELSRLIDRKIAEIERDRVGVAKQVASDFEVILVLKGVPTVIALPSGAVFVNPTGNSGLASGGSGDVLTGMIVGLLAQGLTPSDAAIVGVYLHGLIADRLRETTGERAMIAGDLVRTMPEVLKTFE
ncbi:MAG: NAD(P)H-hydrate dehydratase [Candidatus Bipolaricaulia bacterium]